MGRYDEAEAEFQLASAGMGTASRYYRQASSLRHLKKCPRADKDHVEARRYRDILRRTMVPVRRGFISVCLAAVAAASRRRPQHDYNHSK